MQGAELSDYIKRAESADDPSATVLALLQDLAAGKVKALDIQEHYKAENAPRLNRMFGIFGAGNLFKAQRMDFGSWMDGRHYREDMDTYLELKATSDMCRVGKERARWPDGLHLFVCKLVLPSPSARKERSEFMGVDKMRTAWGQMMQREGWNWRANG